MLDSAMAVRRGNRCARGLALRALSSVEPLNLDLVPHVLLLGAHQGRVFWMRRLLHRLMKFAEM